MIIQYTKLGKPIKFGEDTVRTIQCIYEFPLYNTKELVIQIDYGKRSLKKSLLNKKVLLWYQVSTIKTQVPNVLA